MLNINLSLFLAFRVWTGRMFKRTITIDKSIHM